MNKKILEETVRLEKQRLPMCQGQCLEIERVRTSVSQAIYGEGMLVDYKTLEIILKRLDLLHRVANLAYGYRDHDMMEALKALDPASGLVSHAPMCPANTWGETMAPRAYCTCGATIYARQEGRSW